MCGGVVTKYLVTALIVVVVSEIAKKTDRVGALIASLPLTTILVLFWLYYEKATTAKLSSYAYYTFWYVLPTLPMFLLMPWMLDRGYGFGWAMAASCVLTVICFLLTVWIGKFFGVDLM
ncbi:MAG: DUF3147 family protein [Opitutales bacterium]